MKTEIITILDRSGSMWPIKADMEGGFNKFIADQREVKGECQVTLVMFNDSAETVYVRKHINDVPPLDLVPIGNTALLDAIGSTMNDVGNRLAVTSKTNRPDKVIFVIITDGEENASKEFTKDRVAAMITHQREKYSWEFVFLGANQDAITVSKGLGILNAATVSTTRRGIGATYSVLSNAVEETRTGGELLLDQAVYDSVLKKD